MPQKKPKAKPPGFAAATQNLSRKPKVARVGATREDMPSWRLSLVDFDGPWGWSQVSEADLRQIVAFLKNMEASTWTEIRAMMAGGAGRRGPKHKFIPHESLIRDAQNRLIDLKLDDSSENWFRFRLDGAGRLWGVVWEEIFYPVWWDPGHLVCPSHED